MKTLALAIAGTLIATVAQAQLSMTIDGTAGPVTVSPSTPVTVTIMGGPGNYNDLVWILTNLGGSGRAEAWAYLGSGTQNLPDAGKVNGSVTLASPSAAGSYVVAFQTGGTSGPYPISYALTVSSSPPPGNGANACPAGEFVNNTQTPLNCAPIESAFTSLPSGSCSYNSSAPTVAPNGFFPQSSGNAVSMCFCMPSGAWKCGTLAVQ